MDRPVVVMEVMAKRIVSALVSGVLCCASVFAAAPVSSLDGTAANGQSSVTAGLTLDQRVARLENQVQYMGTLNSQITQLQSQVQALQGQVETLQHQVDTINTLTQQVNALGAQVSKLEARAQIAQVSSQSQNKATLLKYLS